MTNPNYRSEAGYRAAMEAYDHALERWPVPCERLWLETRFGEAFAIAFGREGAPPLVLLHGSAGNSLAWAADAKQFAERFRVYAVDLPGEAGRGIATRPPYAGASYPGWLADVLDALELQSVRLEGLSLGGWVSMKFTATQPDRVERLALLAPGGVVPVRRSFLLRAVAFGMLGDWGGRRMADVVFSPEKPPAEIADVFGRQMRHYRPRRDPLPVLSDDELRRLTMPVLLVAGARDALLDMPATSRRLAQFVPQLRAEMLPNAGHALIETAALTVPFLEEGVPAATVPAGEL